jgi:GntR family transcriptional regulator, transcriptional repressor for pyruvate dehydrogenase complex
MRPTSSEHPRFGAARFDASQQIALDIRRYLEQQRLQPGDRIGTEQQLAAEFGVSRPTLREALRLLAGSHLIRVSRGRAGGIFVAHTPGDGMSRNLSESIAMMLATESVSVLELLEARMFLEVPLARMAAGNATPETDRLLDEAIAEAERSAPGEPQFNDADARFHRILAEAVGNELLLAFTGWTLEVCQPSLVEQIKGRVKAEDILGQHRAIARAVRQRRPAAAEKAMRAHLQHLHDVLTSEG